MEKVKGKDKETDKAKAKANEKGGDKGKTKEPPPMYDYIDGSVYDSAIRAYLERGYEMFKVCPFIEGMS